MDKNFTDSPHFLNSSTLIPEYILKRREWLSNGNYFDHLMLGHKIADILNKEKYLVIDCGYGTFSDALLYKSKLIMSTDFNEDEYDVLPKKVQYTFRIADITSDSLKMGLFDNLVSSSFKDFDNEEDMIKFINFAVRHANYHIFLLFDRLIQSPSRWIELFEKVNFIYQDKLVKELVDSLSDKLKSLKISNCLIFTNKEPKYEEYG